MNLIKKIFFSLSCLLFLGNLSAQNHCDSLNYYFNNNNFKKAIKCYLKEVDEKKDIHNRNTSDDISLLNEFSKAYREKDEFLLSEKTILEALRLTEINFGENNTIYSNSILNFALLKEKENNLPKTDSLFNVSIEINNKINADNSNALFLQAKFYTKIRLYDFAESNYLKILIKVDNSNEFYLKSLFELFSIYTSIGDFSKAEKVLLKLEKENITEIDLKLLFLDEIAIYYRKQNNFEKYSKAVYEAANIRLSKYDKDDPEICKSLNNLAFVAIDLGNLEKAKELLLSSFNIHYNKYGFQNELSASYLNNLGIVYDKLGNFEKAEFYLKKTLILRENLLGVFNEDFLSTVNNLSVLYYNFNYFEKALDLYEKYIDKINLKLYSQYDPYYLTSLVNYGSIYKVNNNYQKANECFIKSLDLLNPQIRLGLNFMSILEFNTFKNEFLNSIEIIYSYLNDYSTQYPEINVGCYENELLVKNLSLRNQQRIKTSIEKSNDALLKSKYQQFIDNKRQIAKLEELPIAKRSQDYESLKIATEIIEKDLTRQSFAFADAKKSLSVTWKSVQDKLQPNEVAIDLVAYNYYNRKWTDSIVYAAFVVGKDFKAPKYIPLFEQKQLEILIERNSKEDDTLQAKKLNKQYSTKAISDLFFKPLEKELEGKTTLYLSPAGLGHQIDFSALPVSETQTLGEKYQVHILGSTAELVSYSAARLDKSKSLELLLYGGINYSKSKPNIQKVQEPVESNNAIAELRTRSGISGFEYLPGTNNEVKQIAQLGKESGFVSTILNKDDATEESIKQLDGRTTPYVLHLATHGFFFADPKQELLKDKLMPDSKATIYKTADDPMMRSGLLFAGANKYWNTTTENLTTDDGILTANEISNLDLSACQLVVLSACETGLGTIYGSEGVFGLQRAFKMAGVKNIIMSLWKVPDAQTAELFSVFYKECLGGKSIHEAFQLAQAKMRVKYSPYYWAGFVLLE